MRDITTLAIPALESITFDHLAEVSGGCHPKPTPAPAAPSNVQQTQIYAPQIFALQPQTCAVRDPQESVETSVYIGPAQSQPQRASV